jgi:hypothetical protein
MKYIPKTYTPAELEAAVAVLQNNTYHCFEPKDALGIVLALHEREYRIVKTGNQRVNMAKKQKIGPYPAGDDE